MTEEITKAIVLAIPPITGVLAGFLLAGGQRWYERQRKLRSHLAAIRAEMGLCKETAETLLHASIQAPLYRFPVTAVRTGFPILLAEGHLNEDEVRALTKYSSWIDDLNRGLDNAAECDRLGNTLKTQQEYRRNLLKAEELLGIGGKQNLLGIAKLTVDGQLKRWRDFV